MPLSVTPSMGPLAHSPASPLKGGIKSGCAFFMKMGKMGGKEGLKMKIKGRCGVKVKKVIEKGRNLMNFVEKLKVLSEVVMEVLEREGSA